MIDGAKKTTYEIFVRVSEKHGEMFEEILKCLSTEFTAPSKKDVISALIEEGHKKFVCEED